MKYIYIKLTEAWGGFQVGDVVRFGLPKGERILEAGIGVKVAKQQAVNEPIPEKTKGEKVETAMANPASNPKTETADEIGPIQDTAELTVEKKEPDKQTKVTGKKRKTKSKE